MKYSIKLPNEVQKYWNKVFFTFRFRVTLLGEVKDSIFCWFIFEEAMLILKTTLFLWYNFEFLECNALSKSLLGKVIQILVCDFVNQITAKFMNGRSSSVKITPDLILYENSTSSTS